MPYKLKSQSVINAMRWNAKRRIMAKANGDCMRCLRFKAEPGRSRCEICAQKEREKDRKRRGSKPRILRRKLILTTVKDELGEINVNHYQSHRAYQVYCAVDRGD